MGRGSKNWGAKRRDRTAKFVKLEEWMMRSPGWCALSANAKVVYLELKRRFNGANNGTISISTRQAAIVLNKSNDTGARAIQQLLEFGFIAVTADSDFNRKVRVARQFRLTELPDNRPGVVSAPTKDFMKLRSGKSTEIQNAVASVRQAVSPLGLRLHQNTRKVG